MILCKRDTSLRSLVPPNDCAKWEDTIAGCVVNGMIYLKNDYILIFLTILKPQCLPSNCTYQYINKITVQCHENIECPDERPVCVEGLCEGMFGIR